LGLAASNTSSTAECSAVQARRLTLALA
jgi:hypothetical protein